MVLRKTFSAMLDAVLRTTTAVATPETATMPAPASRNRLQLPSGARIERSSGICGRGRAAHGAVRCAGAAHKRLAHAHRGYRPVRRSPPARAGTVTLVLSARNRELLGLLPAALLVIAGFTAIYIQAEKTAARSSTSVTLNHASSVSLTYGAIFLALCLAAHVAIRYALPNAGP